MNERFISLADNDGNNYDGDTGYNSYEQINKNSTDE